LFFFLFFSFVFLAENYYTVIRLLTHIVILCMYCGGKYKTFEELGLQDNLTCM